MRRIVALSALGLTGTVFLVSGIIGLPQDAGSMSIGLKATIIASAIAFLLTTVACVFFAWPEKRQKK